MPQPDLNVPSDIAFDPSESPCVPLAPDRLICEGLSHAGKVRQNNEDHFLVAKLAKSMKITQTNLGHTGETKFSDEDGYLLVVADGMGGAAAGERASALAVLSVEQFTLNTLKWFFHLGGAGESVLLDELRQSVEAADRSVTDEAEADYHLTGMGTTLTVGYCVGPNLYVVHAGDSRAYLFRDGQLDQITSDHTLVQLLVDNGMISPEDARTHARRNIVTNVVGGPRPGVHAEIHKVCLHDGDLLLLCSDGLTEAVPDAEIAAILAEGVDPKALTRSLVDVALDHGAPDNVTVIVARYSQQAEAVTSA